MLCAVLVPLAANALTMDEPDDVERLTFGFGPWLAQVMVGWQVLSPSAMVQAVVRFRSPLGVTTTAVGVESPPPPQAASPRANSIGSGALVARQGTLSSGLMRRLLPRGVVVHA